MTSLSDRAEAGGDAGVLLRELQELVAPAPRPSRVPRQANGEPWGGDGLGPYTDAYKSWSAKFGHFPNGPFTVLLDINTPETHLAAAMMLVPEGMDWQVGRCQHEGPYARVTAPGSADDNVSLAPTPARALIAAIARSIENDCTRI